MPEWFREFFGADYLRAYGPRNRREAPAEVPFIEAALGMRRSEVYLDLCCGEGRHAVPLAARGYRLAGVDLSPDLLAAARGRAAGAGVRVDWVRADSRALPFPGAFDGVYCWFTSFGYFPDSADDRRMLAEVERVLRPGGRFLLEVLNREFLADRPVEEKEIHGDGCRLRSRMEFSAATGLATTRKVLRFADGTLKEYRLVTRVYPLSDLAAMIRSVGLEDPAPLDGASSRGETSAGAPRALRLLARKPLPPPQPPSASHSTRGIPEETQRPRSCPSR
ncbi:MAG: class I SAM-dependent methyltransferase [Acidobacteria bacterium]|nr:class I SAM-dependent methyltransferase [Acidobacteriota bacterium]